MKRDSQQGFTIVEVLMFLAISGLFLIIAFAGLGGRTREVQFTDAMRNLQSFIQRQYNDVFNGLNLRDPATDCNYVGNTLTIGAGGDPTGQSDCTILGRLIEFDGTQANVYTIAGRRLTAGARPSDIDYLNPESGDKQQIIDSAPHIIKDSFKTTYDIKWQTAFKEGMNSGPNVVTKAFGFIRSPGSVNIYTFVLPTSVSLTGPGTVPLNINAWPFNNEVSVAYCFAGAGDKRAELYVGGSNRSDSIEIAFDTGCAP